MKTIKKLTFVGLTFAGIAIPTFYSAVHAQGNTFTGTVEQVWEDGFRLNTGDRTFRVDSWDVCGDNTMNYLSAKDPVKVSGEFSGLEFDAFSITDNQETPVCTASEYRE
ncbi:hypothetical protein [Pleurocapsa sp. PCC 7319]|uniref:hypothetical protein n=1 Tax=Pleurocapsa sp. PCC 7319 TaxID=118161 RepID=UPI00034B39C4|nr:hypothetical protein [Pleurocapsa sp. PCC 7319]